MGHIVSKDIYRELGARHEQMLIQTPWNEKYCSILKEFFTPEEASLIIKMPYTFSTLNQLAKSTGIEKKLLLEMLNTMCNKGIVMDIVFKKEPKYIPAPMLIGFFEFSLMRIDKNLPQKEWSKLFNDYICSDEKLFKLNYGNNQMTSAGRALPYEETFSEENISEILDYESSENLLNRATKFAIGSCSCRHEQLHLGTKRCAHPLDTCISLNAVADFTIRRNFAKEVTREEVKAKIAEAKAKNLVLICDNVKNKPGFICCCCGCCCHMLKGITEFGFLNVVSSSNYMAKIEQDKCIGCGKCEKQCHVNAIEMQAIPNPSTKKNMKKAYIKEPNCLGCSACITSCPVQAIKMEKNNKRVFHPEDVFEKLFTAYLERGLLQNLIFSDPVRKDHRLGNAILGGFLKLKPVQQALLNEKFKSKFLEKMRANI